MVKFGVTDPVEIRLQFVFSLRFTLNVDKMRLCIAACLYIFAQIAFACSQPVFRQPTAKHLVSQPDAIGVDDVSFAVCIFALSCGIS